MSTHSRVDPTTLGWVKNEIDETLNQARLALESFAENPADKTRLRFCLTHLHQVSGTLLMVELDGAAMLARETEAFAEALVNDQAQANEAALEVLTRAILTLPDYLARLQAGQPDVPLRQLPLVNEMRALYGVAALAEYDLFSPDLSVRPPRAAGAERLPDPEYAALARDLRPRMQQALLGWLRDASQRHALEDIGAVFDQLQHAAAQPFAEQLFWVAGALIEAFVDNGLEPSAERKKLFARIDQQLKRIMDGAERSLLRKGCEELVRAMLYEIAQSQSAGGRVQQLRHAFALDALLSRAEEVVSDLPSPEALASVSQALAKEIEIAQDLLSAYFDPQHRDETALARLGEQLHKMAGILDMLGVSVLKRLVEELAGVVRAIEAGELVVSEALSMPMAQALLLIESSTRDFQQSAADWAERIEGASRELHALVSPDDGVPDAGGIEVSEEVSEAEFRQLVGVVAAEIGVNLGKVEEALEAYASDMSRSDALEPVPGLINQIIGALQIIGQERAAEFAEQTRRHVEALAAGELIGSAGLLDALAVSVGTIGAYVGGLRAGRSNLEAMLVLADRDMRAALRHGGGNDARALLGSVAALLDEWLANPEASAVTEDLFADLETVSQRARGVGEAKIERIAQEIRRLVQLVQSGSAALGDDVMQTLRQSCEALTTLGERVLPNIDVVKRASGTGPAEAPPDDEPSPPTAARAPVAPTPVPKTAAVPAPEPDLLPAAASANAAPVDLVIAEDADPEVVEIFIEEARDVHKNIVRELATLSVEPDNTQALLELRRGYHTIKGSGRMIGAKVVSELAWAMENMLNKVRDGKVALHPAMLDVLRRTQQAFPAMITQLEGGPTPRVDVAGLCAEAEALSQGQVPVAPVAAPAAVAPSPPSAPVVVPTAAEDDLPVLDQVLLDIFVNEATGHLATLRKEVTAARAAGGSLVSDPLFRAAHTLLGNARSLGINSMAEACLEVEKLLQHLRSHQLPIEPAHLVLVERLEAAIKALVDRLASGQRSSGEVSAQLRLIGAEAMALAGGQPAPVVETPTVSASAPAMAAPPAPATPAPAPSAAPAAAPEVLVAEQIDPEMLEIFQEEATDILGTIDEVLARWQGAPEDREPVFELKRALHTLKGGARMAGTMTMGTLAHNTESAIKQVEDGKLKADRALFDLLAEAHDGMVSMLDALRAGRPVAAAQQLNARLLAVITGQPMPAATPMAPVAAAEPAAPLAPAQAPAASAPSIAAVERTPAVSEVAPLAEAVPITAAAVEAAERRELEPERTWPEPMERRGQVRVHTGLLNQLVNFAGEVSISRSRMEQQVYGFRDNLAELSRNVLRFREQIRDLEIQSESQILYRTDAVGNPAGSAADFDPLEFDRFTRMQQLTRQLAESLHDLSTIQGSLGNFVGEAEATLAQQARINTDLQEGLMRTRMVAFNTQATRLRHLVRTTARELGKRVDLDLQGAEVELDRTVLDRMVGPFEHMIRNSIDHGIESPDRRARSGKPSEGRITIAVAQSGGDIVIRFADDGAGLNLEAIRAKAIERGLADKTANLTEDEIVQFILTPGFSTATTVTHVSGRGVGMDVVHSEVKQLGGTMAVETEQGKGTTFTIRLPLTLSITQALMVYVGDQQFAVPIASVANIVEYPVERLAEISVGKNPLLNHGGQVYPYLHLGRRFGITSNPRNARKVPVLIGRAGSREVAIQIDALGGAREIVIKALGPQLAEIKGLGGATILGDGRVVLILDVPGLWFREDILRVEHRPGAPAPRAAAAKERERPVVMVVDDSLTVRKVTGKHLQKRGMEVVTAKDGLDAWEQLRDRMPDIMLVDIEMPRMDGYELTQRVRGDERLGRIPIIMITSRAGTKHRQRALDLGVDVYLSKPYQEDDLFNNIETLLAQGRTGAGN